MTAQGEDILAWLDDAIAEREQAAQAANATAPAPWTADIDESETGLLIAANGEPLWDCEGASTLCMTAATSVHAALNDPESVLRRCAADRKLLDLHRPDGSACVVCADPEQPDENSDGEYEWSRLGLPFPCPTVAAIAEGYGSAGGKR